MQHLKEFVLSEGACYQDLVRATGNVPTRHDAKPDDEGLDGWLFLMWTPARDFALLYLENKAEPPRLSGFTANARYRWTWFDPRRGEWLEPVVVTAAADGAVELPPLPAASGADRAAKIVSARRGRCRRRDASVFLGLSVGRHEPAGGNPARHAIRHFHTAALATCRSC